MDIAIRRETADDYRAVEELTRRAFWNMYSPGCCEHYLVHVMRSHPDFCGDLDFVAECDGRIVGSILYTKSHLIDGKGARIEIRTFGPISVLPEFQRKGVGSKLIRHTVELVRAQGYPAVVIFGNPSNYVTSGFKGCGKYNVSYMDGKYPTGLLVLPLREDVLQGNGWTYAESDVYNIDRDESEKFDEGFPPMEKKHSPSQEVFDILSRSFVAREDSPAVS
jgi:putative acetyltransferase